MATYLREKHMQKLKKERKKNVPPFAPSHSIILNKKASIQISQSYLSSGT